MSKKFKISLTERLADFKLPVSFTMPNGEEAKIVFTVKHLTPKEVKEMFDVGKTDVQFITELATGWDLEDEFNEGNAQLLVEMFPGSAIALPRDYMAALIGQRAKN